MRTTIALITLTVLLLEVPSGARQPSWKMSATVAESCSCTVSCPCNFGGEPSHMPCEGNRIISIDSGNYDGVDLAGVQLLVTFNMRNWSKIYVSDKVSDRQMKAIEAMLPLAFAGFHKCMLSFTKAPITMELTDTRAFLDAGIGGRHGSDARVRRQAGAHPQPAQPGLSELHAVSIDRAHAHGQGSDVVAQGHELVHVDDGCRESAITT
jgi:hypothetical protein